jgi:hypothetical protein
VSEVLVMINALRAKPSRVFMPYAGNVALYLFLLARGARGAGILISAIMAAAGLLFIYGMLKQGFVVGRRGGRYTIDGAPGAFWASAIFCFVCYLLATFAAVGFYFQDRGRGLIS